MIVGVYSVKDLKTTFLAPTFDMYDESAIRQFEHNVMLPDGIFNSHAADFQLYKIGEFDTDSAIIYNLDEMKLLREGSDVLKKKGRK